MEHSSRLVTELGGELGITFGSQIVGLSCDNCEMSFVSGVSMGRTLDPSGGELD